MKLKTTTKAIKDGSSRVYWAGYCELQTLLRGQSPFAYTSGLYGWNYDAYDLGGGVTLCTGYRGMPGKALDYKQADAFEQRARSIMESRNISWEQKETDLAALFNEFCEWVKSL